MGRKKGAILRADFFLKKTPNSFERTATLTKKIYENKAVSECRL